MCYEGFVYRNNEGNLQAENVVLMVACEQLQAALVGVAET